MEDLAKAPEDAPAAEAGSGPPAALPDRESAVGQGKSRETPSSTSWGCSGRNIVDGRPRKSPYKGQRYGAASRKARNRGTGVWPAGHRRWNEEKAAEVGRKDEEAKDVEEDLDLEEEDANTAREEDADIVKEEEDEENEAEEEGVGQPIDYTNLKIFVWK